MSKKNKQKNFNSAAALPEDESDESVVEAAAEDAAEDVAAETAPDKAKDTKAAKNVKKTHKKGKRPNIFKRMWHKIKEIASELKRVTWPSFKTVVKQTCVVLVVVLFFLVLIYGIDLLLTQVYNLLS